MENRKTQPNNPPQKTPRVGQDGPFGRRSWGAGMVGKDGCRQGGVARGRPLVLVDRTTWAKGVGGGVSFLVGGGFGEGVSVGVWTLGNKCGVIGDGTGSGVTVTEGGCLAGVAKQVPNNLVLVGCQEGTDDVEWRVWFQLALDPTNFVQMAWGFRRLYPAKYGCFDKNPHQNYSCNCNCSQFNTTIINVGFR